MPKKPDQLLRKQVRDVVTGFQGCCTAYAVYMTGCNQICITPSVDKDGKPGDSHWFDLERCEVIKGQKSKVKSSPTGGERHGSEAPPTK